MLPRERFFRTIQNQKTDKIPNFNIIMGFSAAYSGRTYREYASDYKVLCECDLRCAEDFRLDILSAISDPMREAESFGAEVLLPEDGVPYSPVPLLTDLSQVKALHAAAPENSPRTLDRLKAVEYFKKTASRYVIGGWVEGAFAECCDLRGIDMFMMDIALEEPERIHEFLQKTCEQAIRFALLQIEAGADVIGIGDAAASLISPEMFAEFAFPYQKKIVDAVHAAGAHTKLHICGNTTAVLPQVIETGSDLIDLDWMVDLATAKRLLQGRHTVLCGNYDPVAVLLQGTPGKIAHAVNACADTVPDYYISSAGCEVPRDTPTENLLAVADALDGRSN